MRKALLKTSLTMLSVLLPAGIVPAQTESTNQIVTPENKFAGNDAVKAQQELEARYPLLQKMKLLTPRTASLPNASLPIVRRKTAAPSNNRFLAYAKTPLWANLAMRPNWTSSQHDPYGYFLFNPTNPVNYTSLFNTADQTPARSGVQYKNGHLYGLELISSWGNLHEYLFDTDTETGETKQETLEPNSQINLAAVETAQADDGTVYGVFYSQDGQSYEWGTVDYSTKTRTTIAPTTKSYVAIGITNAGVLYGVASDGNLYKVDKTTGAETLVGPTGLAIADYKGQCYQQTGEINNKKDDAFYWCALDSTGTGGLYEINLQTGAASLIAAGSDQVFGMYIPAQDAADGAPAKASDLSVSFTGTSLSGKVNFTAPTLTFSDAKLEGSLSYTIKANKETVATGTTTAGSKVSVDVVLPSSGNYDFEVTSSNQVGESPKALLSKWIGEDTPISVGNLVAVKDGSKVNLSWDAPYQGIHKGALGTLTYDIYRIAFSKSTKIASDVAATNYTDDLEGAGLANYSYIVVAKAGKLESEEEESNGVIVGEAVEPDWTETFDSRNDYQLFTVVDANKDNRTWRLFFNQRSGTYVYSNYNDNEANDDWIFTPAIHLRPGLIYKVSFQAKNGMDRYPNSLEVKWGTDTTAAAMTNTLLPTTVPTMDWTTYSYEITAPTDGKYYIGFHDNSAKTSTLRLYVEVDNIEVSKGPKLSAPQPVSELTVTPAAKGGLSAEVSFKVPSMSIQYGSISEVDSFQVKRNGALIATLHGANSGEIVAYTDANISESGTYTYEVTPYTGADYGQTASASAFIGNDVPDYPKNLKLFDNQNNTLAMWDEISGKGANGGYVDPSKVRVSFFNVEESSSGSVVGDSLTTSDPGATSTYLPIDPNGQENETQALRRVVARADNPFGSSSYYSSIIVVGNPLKLPYKESLVKGDIDNGFAWIEGNAQAAGNDLASYWRVVNDASADGDAGSILWSPYTVNYFGLIKYVITPGDEVSINTPKISLQGASNPKLYFNVNATVNDPAKLRIDVQTPDGVNHQLTTFDLSTTKVAGWSIKSVDLSAFTSYRYVMVKFRGIADGSDVYVGIDNINIFDQLQSDMAATGIKTPQGAKAGSKAKIDVYVENFGEKPATGYSVILYSGDKGVDTVTVSKQLPTLAVDTVALSLPVPVNNVKEVSVKAKVVIANDLNGVNDTTEVKSVVVNPSEYTKVNDLSATANNSNVSLKWTKPAAAEPVAITEDFESYDPFSTEFGEWGLVDGDKGLAQGFLRNMDYPGQGTAFAFEAFNPNEVTDLFKFTDAYPGFTPHSGNQFAAAPYVSDASGRRQGKPDNWIISPAIPTTGQTIKFYAFNGVSNGRIYTENFDVLYSTTDADTASFVKIDSYTADGQSDMTSAPNWKEITVEIPKGASYFAIHHNTLPERNNFFFGLDDISYQRLSLGIGDTVIAYNIYRDGELIGTVSGTVVTFNDGNVDGGNHVYNVTVVYRDSKGNTNESGLSNDATVEVVDGIQNIDANSEGLYDVYTIDGKTVKFHAKSLNGLTPGIYIINNRKHVIK